MFPHPFRETHLHCQRSVGMHPDRRRHSPSQQRSARAQAPHPPPPPLREEGLYEEPPSRWKQRRHASCPCSRQAPVQNGQRTFPPRIPSPCRCTLSHRHSRCPADTAHAGRAVWSPMHTAARRFSVLRPLSLQQSPAHRMNLSFPCSLLRYCIGLPYTFGDFVRP